jgi:hypothetical protein
MLVIVEGLHGGDAVCVARAEFFAQAEGVGHKREEDGQVTEVTLWASPWSEPVAAALITSAPARSGQGIMPSRPSNRTASGRLRSSA